MGDQGVKELLQLHLLPIDHVTIGWELGNLIADKSVVLREKWPYAMRNS